VSLASVVGNLVYILLCCILSKFSMFSCFFILVYAVITPVRIQTLFYYWELTFE
jgi:hypothetical protein